MDDPVSPVDQVISPLQPEAVSVAVASWQTYTLKPLSIVGGVTTVSLISNGVEVLEQPLLLTQVAT